MLTAKLVRLDTAWSATPQLRRFPTWWAIRHGVAPLLPVTAASPRLTASAIMICHPPVLRGERVTASTCLLGDLRTGWRERGADLTPEHVVHQIGRQQFLDPPQPHVA